MLIQALVYLGPSSGLLLLSHIQKLVFLCCYYTVAVITLLWISDWSYLKSLSRILNTVARLSSTIKWTLRRLTYRFFPRGKIFGVWANNTSTPIATIASLQHVETKQCSYCLWSASLCVHCRCCLQCKPVRKKGVCGLSFIGGNTMPEIIFSKEWQFRFKA